MAIAVSAPAPAVHAAGKNKIKTPKSMVCSVKKKAVMDWDLYTSINITAPKGAKINSVKSSNKKVVEYVQAFEAKKGYDIQLHQRKAGKAKISIKVTYKGKTTSLTTNVTVKKYQRPCSQFKIGNKNYASKFNNTIARDMPISKSMKGRKVSIKAAKGWKLCNISEADYVSGKVRSIKNNQKLKWGANGCIMATFKKNGSNQYEYLNLNLLLTSTD